jgi:glycosyltransferase involved in cell wall biosynthesis
MLNALAVEDVRIRVLAQSNAGAAAARNRGVTKVRATFTAFLDADDAWAPSHLANAAALLHDGADAVVSGVRTSDLVKKRVIDTTSPSAALARNPVLTLFKRNVITTSSSVVITRALAERTGAFDTSLRIGEDRDYWLRCALAGARFEISNGFTCDQARHPSSSMARTYVVAQHLARFYEKYRSLAAVPERLRRRLLADSLVCLGRLLREHDRTRSAACLWRAWRCEPFNPRILCHLAFTGWRSVATPSAA